MSVDLVTVGIGTFWSVTTAFYSNSANTWFLGELKSAVAHNTVRFLGSTLLCLVCMLFTDFTKIQFQKVKLMWLPALLMIIMNTSNSLSLDSVGVTLTYVIKATIPVWTCLYCYLFEGKKFSNKIIFALLTSCVGVALASFGDMTFNWTGFFFACCSCVSQCAFNIFSKKCMTKAGIRKPMQGFATSVILAAGFGVVLYQFEGLLGLKTYPVFSQTLDELTSTPMAFDTTLLLIFAGSSYWLEYGANFIYVTRVSSVTFAITDIVRRLGTIGANAVIFGYELTPLNGSGIVISLSGALMYSVFVQQGGGKAKAARSPKGKRSRSRASTPKRKGTSPSPMKTASGKKKK